MKKIWLVAGSIVFIACLSIGLLARSHNQKIARAQVPNQSNELPFSPTTVEQLQEFLQQTGENIRLENGQLMFEFGGVSMGMMTAPEQDRMRIIAPIIEVNKLEKEELENMLIANFHTTLDGRYTISNGIVFAAFIHPLSSLPERDFRSALQQVSQLVKNFGTSYSSRGLIFAPGVSPQPQDERPGNNLEI